MSTIPNAQGDVRRAIEALTRETPPFTLGTGTAGYTLPDDASITAAGTVAALRALVAQQNQVIRALLTENMGKAIVSPRGRPS